MSEISKINNRRIARNTVFLYVRMILILLVTLYTSRVVLAVLGVEDYGIYNVVGGVVAMFAFLSNSMATATQRFLTFELGRGDAERLRKVFSAAVHIHLAIAVAVVLLAETAGLWLLEEKLVISPERMNAARWVYQFSVAAFFVNVIQVPYNAVIIAHEKMSVYAYVSVAEVVAKLVLVFGLTVVSFDKLVAYGAFMLSLQVTVRVFYQIWCSRRYEECKIAPVGDRSLYREMSVFASWNIFGSLAWVMKDQGLNVVLNLFFGTAVNAARGVAAQVSTSVYGFVSNFQLAMNPQITKNYAQGEIREMENLVFRGLKFSFLLLFFIALPLLLNVDAVLSVWLKDVPDHTSAFIVLIIADTLTGTLFGSPLMTSIAATGRIKVYQMVVSGIILMVIPASYLLLKAGFQPESVFCAAILFTLLSGVARFLFARSQIGFSLRRYLKEVILRVLGLLVLSLPLPLALRYLVFEEDSVLSFFMLCAVSVLCVAVSAWAVLLDSGERSGVRKMCWSRVERIFKRKEV